MTLISFFVHRIPTIAVMESLAVVVIKFSAVAQFPVMTACSWGVVWWMGTPLQSEAA